MNKDSKNEILNIENKIYVIRGKEVVLDSDLAKLYECKNGTKTINQAISRHKDRFPNDFYFQVTNDEYEDLKSQIGTSSWNNYGGIRKLPHVFTEQGVAMLATVLKTNIASEISINIMRAFVKMRHYLIDNKDIYKSLNNLNLRLTKTEIDKYNAQYNNLTVIKDSSFHDRYLIIDNKDIYHLGASINHAGDKVFSIHKIDDRDIKLNLTKTINNILSKEEANGK